MSNTVRIVRTRDTCGGEPRIEGTRMTTDMLYRGWLANGRDAAIVARWMEVPVAWVEAAVAYERHGGGDSVTGSPGERSDMHLFRVILALIIVHVLLSVLVLATVPAPFGLILAGLSGGVSGVIGAIMGSLFVLARRHEED